MDTVEDTRLESEADGVPWKRWGPYVSERSWGTVREDYSSTGDAWNFLTHDMARSKVYRWGEDGIAGFCDRYQLLIFSVAFWNGKDPILKERLFGLNPLEGNHGEDVKECYFYVDATPTYSYAKYLYKYPQDAFPYEDLVRTNQQRGTQDREYELFDTGIFHDSKYFDIVIEYAKQGPEDICIRIEAFNRYKEAAVLHILPHLWFRNRSDFYKEFEQEHPVIRKGPQGNSYLSLVADPSTDLAPMRVSHPYQMPQFYLYADLGASPLFTNNETNQEKLWNVPNKTPFVKDAFHRKIIQGEDCVHPEKGNKSCLHYGAMTIPAGGSHVIYLRLTPEKLMDPLEGIEEIFTIRKKEADEFYAARQPNSLNEDEKRIQRQALAGMLWSKQFYFYNVKQWFQGDYGQIVPPRSRAQIRNEKWGHLYSFDLISMPDKWEYPWFAAWDLAFHCLPLALVDLRFAKKQLRLLLTNFYQHPNGQIPAYEWEFSDLNPPVQAFALWKLYQIEKQEKGKGDSEFLEGCFQKLASNFVWWINKVDSKGKNFFEGGFLGLDNISVIDRSEHLANGGAIEQADGTGWMALFSLMMLKMALELAKTNPIYQEVATGYFEHFVYIGSAIHGRSSLYCDEGIDMWDQEDQFFYDVVAFQDGRKEMLKVRSFVGLIPFYSMAYFDKEELEQFPRFYNRFLLFKQFHPEHMNLTVSEYKCKGKVRYLFSLLNFSQIQKLLVRVWSEEEFLSPYGLRSVSKVHEKTPVNFHGKEVGYEPGESLERMKGGNSNWRGPIWIPTNYLFLEALLECFQAVGKSLQITHSKTGVSITLDQMADSLKDRLVSLFRKDSQGKRPIYHDQNLPNDPHFKDLILFYEHYHGDTGRGLGASHQTGWSGLIACILVDTIYQK